METDVKQSPWLQTTAYLTLALCAMCGTAQDKTSAIRARFTGLSEPTGSTSLVKAGASSIAFAGVKLGSAASHVTASFSVTGHSGNFVPKVSTHYGRDYTLGQVTCSGAGTVEDCTVDVAFTPTLPGGRPDALFVSDGETRLATVILYGTGEGPLALLQPATVDVAATSVDRELSVVDENGALYTLDTAGGTIRQTLVGGSSVLLPIHLSDRPRGMVLDGAGLLFLLPSSASKALQTYDTVRGIEGSVAMPVAASAIDAITLDSSGTVFALSTATGKLYSIGGDSIVSTTALAGGDQISPGPSMIWTKNGGLLTGGAALGRVDAAGLQSRVASDLPQESGLAPMFVDAAGSLYLRAGSRLAVLAGPEFSGQGTSLPAAQAVGSDGALYSGFARTDRGSTALYFDPQGGSAQTRTATLYNGGDMPLSISQLEIAGVNYVLAPLKSASCAAGVVIDAGASCEIAVEWNGTGTENGAVALTSNSLNDPRSKVTVNLFPHASTGSQAVFTPASLSFPSTTVNVAAAPLPIVLSNPGTVALNITSLALTGQGSGSFSQTNNCTVPGALAPGTSCTVTVTFKPLSAASQTASLSLVDDAGGVAGSNQTATISGVGTAAPAPVIGFAPATLTFGSTNPLTPNLAVIAGTSSAPQVVTISNTGNAALNISNIGLTTTAATLPYSSTTTCGTTLAPAATCTFTVTFSPATGGQFLASIVVADNASGTPQSVAITGNASAADYNVTSGATSVTVPSSGGSGTVPIIATPFPAPFPTPVAFTVFGLPAGASFSFSPATISPATAPATTNLVITLPAYHGYNLSRVDAPLSGNRRLVPMLALLFSGLTFGLRRRRLPRLTKAMQMLLVLGLGLAATSMSGCSGGFPVGGGVAPGTYELTITGQSANGAVANPIFPTVHFVVVNLIVQ